MSEVRGIEPSVVMADRIDHIKRQYLSSNTASAMRPSSQAHLQMFGGQVPNVPLDQMGNSFVSASIRVPNQTVGLNEAGSQRVLAEQQHSGMKPRVMTQQDPAAVSLGGYDQQMEAVRKDNWIDGKQDDE